MRNSGKGKLKKNIRNRLAGTPVSFEELVSGAGGITGLSGHAQSLRVGAWPSLHPPVEFIGSAINATYTNSIDVSGIGLSVGDTLIVCACYDDNVTNFSLSGFTSLFTGRSGNMEIGVFSKTLTNPLPTTLNIGSSANCIIAAGFSGVNSTSMETIVGLSSNVSTITPASTSFVNGGGVVIFATQDDSVTATATAPSGYTIANQGGIANSNRRSVGALMYKTDLVSGTETPAAVTWSETDLLAAATIRLDCIV